MDEKTIVIGIAGNFKSQGYLVATEIPNFHRCADIALINSDDEIWIIECKISNMGKAIEQGKTHRLSADKVYIGTNYKKTSKEIRNRLKHEGLGLIYLMSDGTLNVEIEAKLNNKDNAVKEKLKNRFWEFYNANSHISLQYK